MTPGYQVFAGSLAAWQYAPPAPRRRWWRIDYRDGLYVPEYRGRVLRWWHSVVISDGFADFPVVAFRTRQAAREWIAYFEPRGIA